MSAGHEDHLCGGGAESAHAHSVVALDACGAVGVLLVGQTLLIVRLKVRDRGAPCAAVLGGEEAVELRIALIALGILAAAVVDVGPVEHPGLRHLVLFLRAGEVLIDEIGSGVHFVHRLLDGTHVGYARSVVGVGAGVAAVSVGIVVAKSFDQVEAIAVDVVFLHPVFHAVIPLAAHKGVTLVPVVEHAVGMGSVEIVEGIGAGAVKLIPGMQTV